MSEVKRTCVTCEYEDVHFNDEPCDLCCQARNLEKKWTPKGPKGIDIVMVCGETLHVDTVQPEIETVTLNGEQVYPQEGTPKATHIDKPKRAGGTRKGCYDLIALDDYYLESSGTGSHIDVKDKTGTTVATLCAHAFDPPTRIYS